MTSQLKTLLLLGLLSALLIFMGGLLGGRAGIIIAFGLALLMNFTSYWYSDKIILHMYQAKEVDEIDAPYVYEVVSELARRAHIPMPKVYIVPEETPNAFACGRDPEHAAVAVTEGLLRLLSLEALQGALAHEIGHIKNRDILIQTIAAVLASSIVTIANIVQFSAIFGNRDNQNNSNPLVGLLLALLAPIAASLIQMAISRSREYLADAAGARLCGNPNNLANALQTIGQYSGQIPLQSGNPSTSQMFIVQPCFAVNNQLQNLFSTHPALTDRIARLRQMSFN